MNSPPREFQAKSAGTPEKRPSATICASRKRASSGSGVEAVHVKQNVARIADAARHMRRDFAVELLLVHVALRQHGEMAPPIGAAEAWTLDGFQHDGSAARRSRSARNARARHPTRLRSAGSRRRTVATSAGLALRPGDKETALPTWPSTMRMPSDTQPPSDVAGDKRVTCSPKHCANMARSSAGREFAGALRRRRRPFPLLSDERKRRKRGETPAANQGKISTFHVRPRKLVALARMRAPRIVPRK